MRNARRVWIVLPLLLAACVGPRDDGGVEGKKRYLAAKADCEARYSRTMVQLSDCRAEAANIFIRPWYRYSDLMTWAQTKRRELAHKLDRRQISRAEFDRQIVRAERDVEREENRRNQSAGLRPS